MLKRWRNQCLSLFEVKLTVMSW